MSFWRIKVFLPTLPVDDFPVMDAQKLDVSIELESNEFKSLIGNSKFCMGLDESRQYLNGIYFIVAKMLYQRLQQMVIVLLSVP